MDSFFCPESHDEISMSLFALYIHRSDVEEGGETVFPAASGNFNATPGWNEKSACAKRGLSVKPKMGDALLFWSMRPDASLDPSSLHGKHIHCFLDFPENEC